MKIKVTYPDGFVKIYHHFGLLSTDGVSYDKEDLDRIIKEYSQMPGYKIEVR